MDAGGTALKAGIGGVAVKTIVIAAFFVAIGYTLMKEHEKADLKAEKIKKI